MWRPAVSPRGPEHGVTGSARLIRPVETVEPAAPGSVTRDLHGTVNHRIGPNDDCIARRAFDDVFAFVWPRHVRDQGLGVNSE
jgi:hypothetical protein